MNNFIIAFKRFLQNKNTVTVIGVVLIVFVLFLGYRYQINRKVSPISGIPIAIDTIQPRTLITEDLVDTISVAPVVLSDNVLRTKGQVIGMYTAVNTVIPAGSMFYTNTVVSKEDLPDAAFVDLGENEIPYNFPVSMATTYGNSIYPGNYIDIYMKAFNENGELMVGRLIENVKVLAVKDTSGQNVFENSDEERIPAYLIFGLEYELNILLRKASYMSDFSVDLFPVPHGVTVATGAGETVVSSQTLKDFINANTVPNDEITAKAETKKAAESANTTIDDDDDTDTDTDTNTSTSTR